MSIESFFLDLDRAWGEAGGPHLSLKIIGSAALLLQTSYSEGTKDSDVLETAEITAALQDQLRVLAGPDSALYQQHKIYLEVVPKGIPMLPPEPLWHTDYTLRLENFTIHVLDIADVVVTKLKRFNPKDRTDIRAMIDQGDVDHACVVDRFREVIARYRFDGMGRHLTQMAANLNEAERDWFLVDETPFPELDDLYF